MKGNFGIKVKTEDMPRSLWLSPKGTTRLLIHASQWPTRDAAQVSLDAIKADPRNSHIIGKVEAFK